VSGAVCIACGRGILGFFGRRGIDGVGSDRDASLALGAK